jgi:hypothetical protein
MPSMARARPVSIENALGVSEAKQSNLSDKNLTLRDFFVT